MKKTLKITLINILALLFITGCEGSKGLGEKELEEKNTTDNDKSVLTCISKENYDDYVTIEDTYILNFSSDGKKLIEYSEEEKFLFGILLDEEMKKDSYNQLIEQCDELKKYSGIECTISKTEESFLSFVKIKAAELDDSQKERFRVDYTYDEWKELLSDEYSCN